MTFENGAWLTHVKKTLREIVVDPSRFSDDPDTLSFYLEPGNNFPNLFAVIYPRATQELKAILSVAGTYGFSIYTPLPWGLNPPRPGCVVDFRFMNRILMIDERNLFMEIEPGVTWEQALDAVRNLGVRIALPAAAMSPYVLDYAMNTSIYISSVMDNIRQIATFHTLLPDGRDYRSGSDSLPTSKAHWREDGGPNISRAFFSSWNIFGITVGAHLYLYPRREKRKVLQFGFATIDGVIKAASQISRKEIFTEIVILSRWSSQVKAGLTEEEMRLSPPWVMLLGLDGPEDLVTYYEKRVRELVASFGISTKTLPLSISEKLESSLDKPWYSRRHSIGFYTNWSRVKNFYSFATDRLKNTGDISVTIIPVSGGASCFMHFELIGPAENSEETIKPLLRELADRGAFFPSPTGPLASHIFNKQPAYRNLLRTIKEVFDPASILNTGQVLEV